MAEPNPARVRFENSAPILRVENMAVTASRYDQGGLQPVAKNRSVTVAARKHFENLAGHARPISQTYGRAVKQAIFSHLLTVAAP